MRSRTVRLATLPDVSEARKAAIFTLIGAAFIVGGAYLGLTLARLFVPGMG